MASLVFRTGKRDQSREKTSLTRSGSLVTPLSIHFAVEKGSAIAGVLSYRPAGNHTSGHRFTTSTLQMLLSPFTVVPTQYVWLPAQGFPVVYSQLFLEMSELFYEAISLNFAT